jgi:hypothetical protein
LRGNELKVHALSLRFRKNPAAALDHLIRAKTTPSGSQGSLLGIAFVALR